jgi:gentisate 1,2-dioxygenase
MARADAAEVAPGLSLAVQTVLPSSATGSHRHSFWHLYWVASGTGEVLLEKNESRYITTGDIVYVPPWCSHSYSNSDSAAPLVLFALQNLPQLAALGVLMREEEDGARVSVHRSPVQLEK